MCSDAPGELASISVAAALFVSRVGELSCPAREAAKKVAMRCGARGETQAQAPGRRRASRLRSNPPRRGRRSWSRGARSAPIGDRSRETLDFIGSNCNMPRISPPATSPSPAQKKPSAAHDLTHPPPRALPHHFAPFRAAPPDLTTSIGNP